MIDNSSNLHVLHVLANSSPDLNGYAIRSHDLLVAQSQQKVAQVTAITSPFYPRNQNLQHYHELDGIRYFRSTTKSQQAPKRKKFEPKNFFIKAPYYSFKKFFRLSKRLFKPILKFYTLAKKFFHLQKMMKKFEKDIIHLANAKNIDVIHGHTPFRVGLPAMRAAKKIGLPYVHEMRGLWEDSAVAQGRWKTKSIRYKVFRYFENKILKGADAVVTISIALKHDVLERAPHLRNRIFVVPNSVGLSFQNIDTKNIENEDLTKIKDDLSKLVEGPVVGYIGSLRHLEGVDYTAKAVEICKREGVDFRFFVCSSPKNQDQLKDYCDDLGISDRSLITGPISHKEIQKVYPLIDYFVVSRPRFRVTEKVPPIKPLEAMYLGIPTICSNLEALAENIVHGSTGFLFEPNNSEELATLLIKLHKDNKVDVSLVSKQGKEFIHEHRMWYKNVLTYNEVYDFVTKPKS